MVRPSLQFIAHYDYYTVKVNNLHELTVVQIQELEKFASDRRGRLDFATAMMRIGKRIDFDDFNRVLEFSGIKADTVESEIKVREKQKSADAAIGFGKYRGMHYSEIPSDYLLWLKKNYQGQERRFIEHELQSRQRGG
jgi:hypothetical protein